MDLSDLWPSMPRPSRYAPSVPTSGSGCRPPGNSGPRSTSWLQPGIGRVRELEPDLFGVTVEPKVGIGQQAHRANAGRQPLWTCPVTSTITPYRGSASWAGWPRSWRVTRTILRRWSGAGAGRRAGAGLRAEHGMGLAAGSGDPSVGRQARSLARDHVGPAGRTLPGQRGRTLGGWRRRQSVLFGADTIQTNRDRVSATFMRSYSNRIPLGGGGGTDRSGSRGVLVRSTVRQLRQHHRHRRPRGRPQVGGSVHRLGTGRLRPPHLTWRNRDCQPPSDSGQASLGSIVRIAVGG